MCGSHCKPIRNVSSFFPTRTISSFFRGEFFCCWKKRSHMNGATAQRHLSVATLHASRTPGKVGEEKRRRRKEHRTPDTDKKACIPLRQSSAPRDEWKEKERRCVREGKKRTALGNCLLISQKCDLSEYHGRKILGQNNGAGVPPGWRQTYGRYESDVRSSSGARLAIVCYGVVARFFLWLCYGARTHSHLHYPSH